VRVLEGIIRNLNEKQAYREISSIMNTKEMEIPAKNQREEKQRINELRHKFEKFR